jgi:EmrB/QacA subfamily drug resistance transporter
MTATHTGPAPHEPPTGLPPELVRLALVVVLGTFVVQMDATMVNVALDTLRRDFSTSVATVQWISTGYLLAMAMVIAPAGWAVDRFGSTRTWIAALGMFLAGSLLCSAAWSASSLIGFRVIQGIGGGALLPLSQTILAQAAGPQRLGRLMAAVGVPALLGPVVGPILGGIVVDDLSWRWIFLLNVPVCLIAILLSWRIMPAGHPQPAAKLDVLGLVLLSPALAGLVYALSEAGHRGRFDDPHAWIPLIAAGAVLVGFVGHALHSETEPIIDLRLLASRDFAAAAATLFLVVASLLGTMLLLPLYYQSVRGDSALHAGLLLAPQGIGAAGSIGLCATAVDRRVNPRRIAVVGVLLVIAGRLLFTQLGATTSTTLLSAALLVSGAGFGAVVVPVTAVAYLGLPATAIPRATSALRIFQQIGASLGVAVLAVVLQQRLPRATGGADGHPGTDALAHAYGSTFWWAVAFTLAALIPTLLLSPRTPARQDAPT